MTDAERIAGLEGQLKAQASNAAEEARQNAAEIERLRQRCADMEAALTKKWDEDWRVHNPDEARAHDIIKRAADLLQSDRERADAAEKRCAELERERDEAAHQRDYYKGRDDEGAVIQRELEARLAQALEALSDIAEFASTDRGTLGAIQVLAGMRKRALKALRAVGDKPASDTGTGGEQP